MTYTAAASTLGQKRLQGVCLTDLGDSRHAECARSRVHQAHSMLQAPRHSTMVTRSCFRCTHCAFDCSAGNSAQATFASIIQGNRLLKPPQDRLCLHPLDPVRSTCCPARLAMTARRRCSARARLRARVACLSAATAAAACSPAAATCTKRPGEQGPHLVSKRHVFDEPCHNVSFAVAPHVNVHKP